MTLVTRENNLFLFLPPSNQRSDIILWYQIVNTTVIATDICHRDH